MKIQALLRLRILASQATSKEPVGPALGQLGIPIMDFCNKFNTATARYTSDSALNVVVYSYGNQKYDFIIKLPNFLFFIKRCFSMLVINKNPGYISFPLDKLFYLTPFILYEILLYYSSNSTAVGSVLFSEYRRLVHSLKSSGFIIFSN
jgi:hypothetical protein